MCVGGREMEAREVYCKRAVGDCQAVRDVSKQRERLHLKDSSVLSSRWEL